MRCSARGSWRSASPLGLLFIINQGLWKETVETLVLVVAAAAASMAIGVPIGIWAAHNERVYRLLQPILDLMQTLPTFVYLIPVLILFGLGIAPGLIVTVIFAMPAPIRLTYLGITSVPKPMLEAGEAFGATKRQLLWKVELPSALPTIMAGLTQCIMLSLSMVVIAALIGANGLGKPVVRALTRSTSRSGSRPASPSSCSPSSSTAWRRIGTGARANERRRSNSAMSTSSSATGASARALAMLDAGATRAEILEKTGAVLGCAGANLTVEEGEISVLMGLSGSGKSTLLRAVNGLNVPARGNVHRP